MFSHPYKKKILFVFFYLVLLCILIEICSRSYYSINNSLSFFSSPEDLVFIWYPELKKLNKYEYRTGSYNILFLGGSVLTKGWGKVPDYIHKLSSGFNKKVNLVNLSASAHSSLDSYYKYQWIGKKRFDVVLFYHGINEVRANNVPSKIWKNDYSHYSWYDEVNFYFRHPFLKKTGLLTPYFLKHTLIQLERNIVNKNQFIPTQSPKDEWLEYGNDIKTRESFRANLIKIIKIAQKRKENLIIPTFAYSRFYPEYYKLVSKNEKVGYIWVWGKPENVVLGINVHNTIIRHLARKSDFVFLDQDKLMRSNDLYFRDVCHFTDEGSKFFAETFLKKINSLNNGL